MGFMMLQVLLLLTVLDWPSKVEWTIRGMFRPAELLPGQEVAGFEVGGPGEDR